MSLPAQQATPALASEHPVKATKNTERTMTVGDRPDNHKTTCRVRKIPMTYDNQTFHNILCQGLGLVTGNNLIVHSLSKDVKYKCTATVTFINCSYDVLLEAPLTSEVEEVSKNFQI